MTIIQVQYINININININNSNHIITTKIQHKFTQMGKKANLWYKMCFLVQQKKNI